MIRAHLAGLETAHVADVTSALQSLRTVTDVMVTLGDPSQIVVTGSITREEFEAALAAAGEFSLIDFDPEFVPVETSRGY